MTFPFPMHLSREGAIRDPHQANVIMSLHMQDSGDGYTLVDSSGYGNTFTRAGQAHISVANKKFGESAAYFDGTGDYYYSAEKSLYNQPGDYTVELWVYWNRQTTSGTTGVVSHGTGWDYDETTLMINNSNRFIQLWSNSTQRITGNVAVTDNVWSHISYGRSGSLNYLYLNGILQGTWTSSFNASLWSCTLGATGWQRTTTATDKFRGYMDEFRWWKGVSVRNGVNNFVPPNRPWKDV